MAHPKLATVFNRSLLAASTAALIAGPLALAGSAQTLETVTDTTSKTLDLTCDEAKETEDLELIEEFCEPEEITDPVDNTTKDAERKARREAEKTTATVEETTGVKSPVNEDDEGGDDGSGGSSPDSSPTGTVLPPEDTSGSDSRNGARQVRNQGEQPRGISAGGPGGSRDGNPAYGGSMYSGMRSNSALTLQPFASPLVSVPPVYELPQVAQQLFGLDEPATTGDPMVAMAGDASATSAYSTTGAPADASGWLAATATGLIMLLGAGHALNGARTPKRKRA